MNSRLDGERFDLMLEAILSLKNKEECSNFLIDLCTIPELQAMVQRLQVAKMLHEKKVYSEIAKETGASTATISRVNRALNYGNDGYITILERLGAEIDEKL